MESDQQKPAVTGIRGVIFDLDGTLYPFSPLYKLRFFLHLLPHPFRLLKAMSCRKTFFGADMQTAPALLLALATEFSKKSGGSPNVTEALSWLKGPFYKAFIKTVRPLAGSRHGIQACLSFLAKSGIRCAVLSDFSAVPERLNALTIDPALFDICLSAEELGCCKPALRPYRTIIDTWGFPPEAVLMIGDRDDTDGAAAREIGMQFLQIQGSKNAEGYPWEWIEAILAEMSIEESYPE